MSLLVQTSPKHCAEKGIHLKKLLKKRKKLVYLLSTLTSSILFILLLAYLVLRPSKPEFYLRDAAVYDFALSPSPGHLLNSTIQATLLTKNPNSKLGIYYDDIRAYAVYKGEQITADSSLPGFYQGHQDVNLLSASLQGSWMPVAESIGYEVGRDQTVGRIEVSVRLDGLLRWKVGSWVSGRYRFDVDCVAVVGMGTGVGGRPLGPAASVERSVQGTQCSTSV